MCVFTNEHSKEMLCCEQRKVLKTISQIFRNPASPVSVWHDPTPIKGWNVGSPCNFRNVFNFKHGNVPFFPINVSHLFSLCSWPPHSVAVAMGGLIGVAPDRKQLTAVQEVDNKGHTKPQARKKRVSECLFVYIYNSCVSVSVYVILCK